MISFVKPFNSQNMRKYLLRLTIAYAFPSLAPTLVPSPKIIICRPNGKYRQKVPKTNTKGYRSSNTNIRKRKSK